MDFIKKQPILTAVIVLVVGLAIGLIIGWVIWPVDWQGGGPQHLAEADQDLYLISLSKLYEFNQDSGSVQQALAGWDGAVAASCDLASRSPENAARLDNMVRAINNNQGCTATAVETPEEGGGFSALVAVLLLGLLALIAVAIWFVWNSRNGSDRDTREVTEEPVAAAVTSVVSDDDLTATPVARFRTNYNRGHDTYDDSFSIESSTGDFLGECGVGISEAIGTETPKKVTAFEVWLFDKNDIRTVTKVVMSDHAFFDEGFKAKLAPKGEPVLARPNETIVLETASLIVNAEITEMDYADADQGNSYFDRLTVELSAWAKEGDFDEPDIQGRIDEMLDY